MSRKDDALLNDADAKAEAQPSVVESERLALDESLSQRDVDALSHEMERRAIVYGRARGQL